MKKNIILSFIIIIALMFSCGEKDNITTTSSSDGVGGSTARFAITGNYLYTVDNWNLNVFNISDVQQPEFVKAVSIGFNIETIFPKGNTLFIGSNEGMYIFDITSPETPAELSIYRHILSCDPVVVQGNYAYVTLHSGSQWCWHSSNELQIVDISNLSNPSFLTNFTMNSPLGLGIDSTTLFVCDNGLKIYDVTNIFNIDLKHHFSISANDVIPINGLLMVTGNDGIYQYNYSNDTIQFLGKINISPTL